VIVDSSSSGPPPPRIESFFVNPRSGYVGDEVRASWEVINADSIVINPGGHMYSASFWAEYVPLEASGDMTLTAYGEGPPTGRSWPVYTVPPGENRYPYLSSMPVDTVEVIAGEDLYLEIYAFDPDSTIPGVSVAGYPPTADFQDFGSGVGWFSWHPTIADTGLYSLMSYAIDAVDPTRRDSIPFWIRVRGVNHAPTWTFDNSAVTVFERDTLRVSIQAEDVDGTIPNLAAQLYLTDSLAPNMSFVDSGNGVGAMTFIPDHFQGNLNPTSYGITFRITDGEDPSMVSYTAVKRIYVRNRNTSAEIPTITLSDGPGPLFIEETGTLAFEIQATTSLGDLPEITAPNLPAGATLEFASGPAIPNYKIFEWTPDFGTAGDYVAVFYAANGDLVDSSAVAITVSPANRPPVVYALPGTPEILEEDTATMAVIGADPDSTVPVLDAYLDGADSLAWNMTFVDSGNGRGVLTFIPNRLQGGCDGQPAFFYVRFRATDVEPPYHQVSTGTRTIKVWDNGQLCCIGVRGDINYSGNGSGEANISDLNSLVQFLFLGVNVPCWMEADINGDYSLTVSDLTYFVDFLFRGGPAPTPCPIIGMPH
jgi:hypothetical protein